MNSKFLKNRKGSALLIALVVLIILIIMSTVFIERLLSFSKSSEGVENSNVAYYHALGSIEKALFTGWVDKFTPWNIATSAVWNTTITGSLLKVLTGSTTIPVTGFGNSPYDSDWNMVSLWSPVQLVVPDGIAWDSVNFYFRIPKLDSTQTSTNIDTSLSNSGVILWMLTSTGNTLFASGETSIFLWSEIDGIAKNISGRIGITNEGIFKLFRQFYTNDLWINGNDCAGYRCTLKLSMIRPVTIMGNPNTIIPFLEYKITGFNKSVPQQYMHIQADGYAYGFMRSRTIELPQITTSNTLDFAVVQ